MTTDHWEQIEPIFHRALELPKTSRDEYLLQICGSNQTLRAEIESLLASSESEAEFLEEPAFEMGMKVLEKQMDVSLTGQQIGKYKILEKLGSGGMGDVYLGEDTKLGRQVALKFLSDSLIDDARAKRHLFREAKALTMIDHPNICRVIDVCEVDKYSFLVMQYIEGETLADSLKNKKIKENQFIDIACQIADALSAIHKKNIIHRDIKAGNIIIMPDGTIKVLDFGLAKTISNPQNNPDGVNLSLMTQPNAIAGTTAYMSPEQLRGETLDYRSDIFSLGTVYYEMVTGRNPFLQTSNAETISAILTAPVKTFGTFKNPNYLPLNQIIKKCLEKNKEKRYESAEELKGEFQKLEEKIQRGFLPVILKSAVAAIVLLVLLTLGIFVYQRAVAPRSLAILPFSNLSANSKNDFMSGMTETLIRQLTASSNIKVSPFTQVSNYKSNDVNPIEIGQALQVDAVLTGKIVEQNNQLVLQTNLINIADGSQLWSENNAFNETDSLDVQNKISKTVISKLESSLSLNNKKLSRPTSTNNPEAYKYYLQGLNFWKVRDKINIKKSIDSYNQAIAADPQFALAYSGLAYAYIARTSVHYQVMPANEAIILAKSYAETAISLDDSLSEPYTALGAIFHKFKWQWADAENQYRKSIELNPSSAQTYYWYSDMLAVNKRFDEAFANSLKAREFDPFSPSMDMNVGRVLYYARRYEESEKYLKEAISKNPKNYGAKLILGFVYLQNPSPEKQQEAVKIFEELYTIDKESYISSLGYAYGKTGNRTEALKLINELGERETKDNFVPTLEKAFIYVGLDDKENALTGLEKAQEELFTGASSFNVDPAYDNLRGEQRFQNILSRMNLNFDF